MKKWPLLIALFLSFSAIPAAAQESAWSTADYVQARLLSRTSALEEGHPAPDLRAALEIRLDEGWHAYWRMPGDGGLPPRLDWSGSANVGKVDVLWPVPERFETQGLYSFGYQNAVLLPLHVDAVESGKPVTLALQAEIMVCREICVPQKIALALTVPPGVPEPTIHRERIDEAQARVPAAGDEHPRLKIENIIIGPEAIVVIAWSASGFDKADLFVESGDLYVTAAPEITIDKDDRRKAMIRVAAPEEVDNLAKELSDVRVTLTLTNGHEATEKTVTF